MQRLRQMSVFAHVVECGSISAAAEKLALSKSVISQHLKALEQSLGVTLLKRTTRRQNLTSAGLAFYQQCQQLNIIAEQAWAEALHQQQQPVGKVKITAPHALMGTLVAPALGPLMVKFPQLQLQLLASDSQLDLNSADVDLAIRVGESGDSNLKQRRIGSFRDILTGTAELLAADGQLPYIANQWQGEVITHEFRHDHSGEVKCVEYYPICRANSFHACLALIQQGAGIGLVPEFIFRQQHKLEVVMPDYQLAANSVYALHPFQSQLPLGVEVCIQAIEAELNKLG